MAENADLLRCVAEAPPVETAAGTQSVRCGAAIATRGRSARSVIFLDIDGVLNRWSTTARIGPWVGLDEELVGRFLRLLRQTGADVVLSSTWRTEEELSRAVRAWINFVGETPVIAGTRGEQIAAWLKQHPGYERHAVIDDDREVADELMPFFTDPATGLTPAIAEAVAQHLTEAHWVHVEPGGPCAYVPDDAGSLIPRRMRAACGLPRQSHDATDHVHVPPEVERDHAAVAPSQ